MPLDADQLAAAKQLAESGLSAKQIGQQLGVNYQTVSAAIFFPVPPEVERVIRDMLAEGSSDTEIGEALGRTHQAVKRLRDRLGIPRHDLPVRDMDSPAISEYRRKAIERLWGVLLHGRRFESYRIGRAA